MPEITERLSTALADRYRIERHLGEGGMATVYLAEDLKHKRKVAVKVLRPELAAVLGAERFVQEITTTASLQHPHILPLFDSGEADGFLYYVMPYIEGETLRDKLNRETQLGIEEAVRITTEVADALNYAHRHNVIHRDIKPENILLQDGRPMVADFGIALAVSAAAGGRMTETGLSLGTPHYMSPEQATAEKDLTNRSDIYSLGSVLYEMLTGEPPHTGGSAQAIIMKIVTEDVQPVTQLRKSVPPHVAAATAKSLEKLAADRFESAGMFAEALTNPAFTLPATQARAADAQATGPWKRLSVGLAALAAVLTIVALWGWLRRPGTNVAPMTYDVALPDNAPLFPRDARRLSLSPAGDVVVYAGGRDPARLWHRSLIDGTTHPIPGTDGVLAGLAVSPDAERVAFFTEGFLKVVSVSGGPLTTVAEVKDTLDIRWVSRSQVLLSDGDGNVLRWIDVDTREERTRTIQRCLFPHQLPDSDHILCGGGGESAFVWGNSAEIKQYLREGESTGSGSGSLLRGADFRLIDDAYLTYMSVGGDLRAVPFDPKTLRVGRSIVLVPGIRREAFTGAGQYDISANGTLVYAEGANASVGQLVKVTEGGSPVPILDESAAFLRYVITRDGRRLAAVVEGLREQELRIYDLTTGRHQGWLRSAYVGEPLWTPVGDRLIVTVSDARRDHWAMLAGSPNAASPPDTLFSGLGLGYDLLTYSADHVLVGHHVDQTHAVAVDLSMSPPRLDTLMSDAGFAVLSPDARWLAYTVERLGQVLITPYPSLDRRYQIAQGGDPQWLSPTELVSLVCCITFYRVRIDPLQDNPVGVPREWHSAPRFSDTPGQSYTLTPDGSLVYVRAPEVTPVTYLRVIPNWVEQMKRAVDEANR